MKISRHFWLLLTLFLVVPGLVFAEPDTVGGLFPKMPPAAKVYAVDCRKEEMTSRMTAFALQGLINQKSAEVYLIENDLHLQQLKFCGKPVERLATDATNDALHVLFRKYQSSVKKMIVYDHDKDWTWYVALVAAAQEDGIPVTEDLRKKLTAEFGWKGEVEDFRGRWTNAIEAYDWAIDHLMPGCTRQVVFVPKYKTVSIIDYVVATRGFAFRLDFKTQEAEIKKIFYAGHYSLGTSLMGYASDEANITANPYGIGYVVSDFYANGSFWSSFPNKTHTQSGGTAIKAEPGKIYASIMWSDGDNISFDQNPLYAFWQSPDRGKVPVATELSPTLQELNPPLLDWYYSKMTTNDELVAGPTGVQFIYIQNYKDDLFPAWCHLSQQWCASAGFHEGRIWIAPFPSVKYSTYMKIIGLDGLLGEGWRLKTGFPPKIDAYGAWDEDKLYEVFTSVKPDSNAPVFVNFTPIVGGFNKKGGGYSAIDRQVARLQAAYPGRYVFLLPKDEFAAIRAYYTTSLKKVLGSPEENDGLRAVKSGDGDFSVVEQDGEKCWLSRAAYFYLDVKDEFRPKPGEMLDIEMDYLDRGTGEIVLEYDSTDIRATLGGAYKSYPNHLRRTNTGKWQVAHFYVKDAGFGGSENDGADFRFSHAGEDLIVRAVSVHRMEP